MSAKRFPRLPFALCFALAFTALNMSVHPASAAPATIEAAVETLIKGRVVVALPLRTNLVAVSIPTSAKIPDLEVQDELGDWHHVAFDSDHGPDPVEGVARAHRLFSEPVWLGTVDELSIKSLSGRVPGAELHLINSSGDSSRAPTPIRWFSGLWRSLTVPRSADALVPDQPILSRSQWGADESWVQGRPAPASTVDAIFVHHTASPNNYSRSQAAAIVRGIYRYHTKTQDWSDIGYNFLIDRFGRIYEGRGGGIEVAVVGAHARGANTGSSGISLIGNFTSRTPPKAMRVALARLIAWKADVHHMPIVGSTWLSGSKYKRISGHRDANSTACPGGSAYKLLPWLRRAALRYGTPKIYKPRTSTSTLRPDGDGVDDVWRLMSWGSTDSLTWTVELRNQADATVRTITTQGRKLQTGDTSGVEWDGTDSLGNPVPSGQYAWNLSARDDRDRNARGAFGTLNVVNDHLLGTLLKDSNGTWLVGQDGTRRTLSSVALKTQFPDRVPLTVGSKARDLYIEEALPMGPRVGAVFTTSASSPRYVFTGNGKYSKISESARTALGYDLVTPVSLKSTDLTGLTQGPDMNETTRHPPGTFVSSGSGKSMEIWRIGGAGLERARVRTLRPSWSKAVSTGRGLDAQVVPATAGDLALPPSPNWIDLLDGTFVRIDDTGALWWLSGGERRRVLDSGLFASYGYGGWKRYNASWHDIKHLPIGESIG